MKRIYVLAFLTVSLATLSTGSLFAQDFDRGAMGQDYGPAAHHLKIKSFSVTTPDDTLNYPSNLVNLPDEHTTLLPPWAWPDPAQKPGADTYLVFGASRVASGVDATVGATVLETTDLVNFQFASAQGYAEQVMVSPVSFTQCDPTYSTEFDENYAAPGSVIQDPTRPPGNLIMLYEAENHCPTLTNQQPFYATVGFARSSDNGRTWPAPVNSEFGNAERYPVLKYFSPEPTTNFTGALGNAIPAAYVDGHYIYVAYVFHDGTGPDISIRVARAKLDEDRDDSRSGDNASHQLKFWKWYNGAFSQPGIAGLDSPVLPAGCSGHEQMADITHNDDLGLYVMVFVCNPSLTLPTNPPTQFAAWYYSTATSLEREDWTAPQLILNSQFQLLPCSDPNSAGTVFDGFYPSLLSPGMAAGHTKLTGKVFFQNGCDTGMPRAFASRTFTITAEPW